MISPISKGHWPVRPVLVFCHLRSGLLPSNYIHVWALCTDNGPDQAAFRNGLKTELASKPEYKNQIVFDCPCLKHQLHLLTADMLRIVSKFLFSCGKKFGYFSSLAKNLSHLESTWTKAFKSLEAYRAKSLSICCQLPCSTSSSGWTMGVDRLLLWLNMY